jgi:hypothetical protein
MFALVAWRAMENVPFFALLHVVVGDNETVRRLIRGEASMIAMILAFIVLAAMTARSWRRSHSRQSTQGGERRPGRP